MSHYKIFLPNILDPTDAQLHDFGIADLVEGCQPFPIERGILCKPGTAYVVQGLDQPQPTEAPEVSAVRTHWVPWHNQDDSGVWFGLDHGCRPGPEHLRREEQYPGDLVSFDDLRPWLVPNIQSLPKGVVDESLLYLTDELRGFLAQPQKQSTIGRQFFLPGSHLLVSSALRANYRLPLEMVQNNMLSLFDFRCMSLALLSVLGIRSDVAESYKQDWEKQTRPNMN